MRTVSIGRQSFERLVRTNHFYVDKTAFIKEWLENDDEVTAITRPRRFGKTLNMDMMHCFFSPKYEGQQDLFSGLFISSYPEIMKLQGTVPVISLSFLGVRGVTRVDFLLAMHETIAKLYDEHSYLLDSDVLDENDREQFKQIMKKGAQIPPKSDEEAYSAYLMQIKMSLQYLSGWLHKYYDKKVILLIDEYDVPLQSAYSHHYYDDAIEIMREFYTRSIKENIDVDRVLITGVTKIAKESLFSDLNHFYECTMMDDQYASFFGFTGEEMEKIMIEYHLESRREDIRKWYKIHRWNNDRDIQSLVNSAGSQEAGAEADRLLESYRWKCSD